MGTIAVASSGKQEQWKGSAAGKLEELGRKSYIFRNYLFAVMFMSWLFDELIELALFIHKMYPTLT